MSEEYKSTSAGNVPIAIISVGALVGLDPFGGRVRSTVGSEVGDVSNTDGSKVGSNVGSNVGATDDANDRDAECV